MTEVLWHFTLTPPMLDAALLLLKLGVPVAGLSCLLLQPLYAQGQLDRSADRKATAADLKKIRKEKKKAKEKAKPSMAGFAQKKWFTFGGGFYGIAALWTFIAVEATDLVSVIIDFPNFGRIASLGDIIGSLIANQIENFVTAITWFHYWGGEQQVGLSFIVAYVGYLAGWSAARQSWGQKNVPQ